MSIFLEPYGSCKTQSTDDKIKMLNQRINELERLLRDFPEGIPGPQGPIGPQGPAGNMQFDQLTPDQIEAIRGPQGFTGAQGEVGPIGPQGPKGDHGNSLKVKGEVQSEQELQAKPQIEGDGYLLNGEMHVWTGTIWQNVGRVQGPEGKPGARGDRGERGPQGEKGDTGAKGERGLQGLPGPAGAAGAIGATGPRGERGPVGATGAAGPQGPRGERGLTGDRGPEGERGPKGDQGEKGDMPNFDDIEVSAVDHANDHTSSGYAKTTATTEGLPNLVNGNQNKGKWGLLVNKLENRDKGQGTQKYYPADGPYHGRVFTRSMNNVKTARGGAWGDWKLTLNEDDMVYHNPANKQCDDMDGCRTSGFYKTHSGTNGIFPSGVPMSPPTHKDGVLEVYSQSSDLIVQRWTKTRGNESEGKAKTYSRVFDHSSWTEWKEIGATVDLSRYYTRDEINQNFLNTNELNTRFSDLIRFISFSKPADRNKGAIFVGDLVIEWHTVTTDRPHQTGGWSREILLEHVGTLCTWSATTDLHNNSSFDYSVCQTKVKNNTHGRNTIEVAVSKGGTAIKLVAFGSILGKQI